MKIDFKNTFWLAIPVVLAIYGVSYLFGLLKIGVTPLFSSVNTYQTITPTLGNKIFGFVSGYIPLNFTLPNILVLLLSAFATLLIGGFLLDLTKWQFLGKGETGRLASVIFWGGVAVYALLIGFKIPSIMVAIGSLIWIFAVSYVAGFLGGYMKKVI